MRRSPLPTVPNSNPRTHSSSDAAGSTRTPTSGTADSGTANSSSVTVTNANSCANPHAGTAKSPNDDVRHEYSRIYINR